MRAVLIKMLPDTYETNINARIQKVVANVYEILEGIVVRRRQDEFRVELEAVVSGNAGVSARVQRLEERVSLDFVFTEDGETWERHRYTVPPSHN